MEYKDPTSPFIFKYASLDFLDFFDLPEVELISQQKSQIELSKAQLGQVKSNFYPNLGFLFSYTRQQIPETSLNASPASAFVNPDQILSKFSAGITGLQGYREAAAYQSAEANIRVQQALLGTIETTLYAQVKRDCTATTHGYVDFTNKMRENGLNVKEALLEACPTRLRAILMTSIATIAAAIPPAVAMGPGAESHVPMAIAVLGGVTVSTLLTLFVVPSVYSILSCFETKLHGQIG